MSPTPDETSILTLITLAIIPTILISSTFLLIIGQ